MSTETFPTAITSIKLLSLSKTKTLILLLTWLLSLPVLAQSPIYERLLAEVRQSTSLKEQIALCHEALQSDELSELETADIYSLLAAVYFGGVMEAYNNPKSTTKARVRDYLRESIKHYTTSIRLNPEHFLSYWHRGYSFQVSQDFERALGDYSKAIEINPCFFEAYKYKMDLLALLGRMGEVDQLGDEELRVRVITSDAIGLYAHILSPRECRQLLAPEQ